MPYTTPSAAALIERYPAFTDVAVATIDAALAEAALTAVDTSWAEDSYQPALMAFAAHQMTLEGQGADVSAQLKGFKKLTVGPLTLERDGGSVTSAAAYDQLAGTVYGQTYLRLLRANKGGPRVGVYAPGLTYPT